jgi:hypothetical protein
MEKRCRMDNRLLGAQAPARVDLIADAMSDAGEAMPRYAADMITRGFIFDPQGDYIFNDADKTIRCAASGGGWWFWRNVREPGAV